MTRVLLIFLLAATTSSFADSSDVLYKYSFSGELQLEDITCEFGSAEEIDWEEVSAQPFEAHFYGKPTDVQQSRITGVGRFESLTTSNARLDIAEDSVPVTGALKVKSLPSIGAIGFTWNGQDMWFYGTSRPLHELADLDAIHFHFVLSESPTISTQTHRYKVVGSKDVFLTVAEITSETELPTATLEPFPGPCNPIGVVDSGEIDQEPAVIESTPITAEPNVPVNQAELDPPFSSSSSSGALIPPVTTPATDIVEELEPTQFSVSSAAANKASKEPAPGGGGAAGPWFLLFMLTAGFVGRRAARTAV